MRKWWKGLSQRKRAAALAGLGVAFAVWVYYVALPVADWVRFSRKGAGVRGEAELAAHFLKARLGSTESQRTLATLFQIESALRQDEAEARRWMRKAPEGGDPDSQYILGMFLEVGYCVPQDEAEAVKWFRQAAKGGNAEARKALEEMGATTP
jgi:TPR repeat protein